MIDRWRGQVSQLSPLNTSLGLLSEGWAPEIACVSRSERVATKIPEMVSWLLSDSCQRKRLAQALGLDILCAGSHLLELPLGMLTSQKTQCVSIFPRLSPPSSLLLSSLSVLLKQHPLL